MYRNLIEKYRIEIILSLIWIIAIVIVDPVGEFPLNDDWAYSRNVYHLSQEGKLILSNWPAMTLIAQVLWGAIVTSVFGFSFTVLRFSTLFIGLFTVLLFYKILINTTSNKATSLAGALLLMFSPLFFASSFTFMTEVYFLFTLNLSLFYFFKFYKSEKIKFLLAGSFFVLASSLIRQPGVAMGAAFAAIYLANKRFSIKHLGVALTPLLIGIVGLYSYSAWLHFTGRTTNYSDISILTKQLSEAPIKFYLTRFGIIALYFGFFSLPVSVILLPRILKNYTWYEKVIMLFLGVAGYMSGIINSFPAGNVVFNLGLGPKLLKDTYWGDNIDPILSERTMEIIKLISLFSAVVVVVFFCKEAINGLIRIFRANSSPSRLLRATFIVFFLIYIGFVLINPIFFDRYILPCIPFFFLVILPVRPLFSRINRIAFGVFLSVYVLFSIAATHDYMAWNRARWEAINYLTDEKKIDRHKIDGGFEFNAWFQTAACNPEVKGRISWWFVSSDDYVVSFGEINGFKTIKKIGYFRLLPLGNDSIYILFQEQKIIPDSAFPLRCDCEKKSVDNNFFLSENIDVDFVGGNLQNNAESLSGQYSIKLDSINQYGLLSKYSNIQTDERFIIKVWRKGSNEAGIVVSAVPGNNLYHFNNQVIETNSNGWNLIKTEITIPENCNGYQLGVYLWNPGKNNVWFDDLEINKLPKKN